MEIEIVKIIDKEKEIVKIEDFINYSLNQRKYLIPTSKDYVEKKRKGILLRFVHEELLEYSNPLDQSNILDNIGIFDIDTIDTNYIHNGILEKNKLYISHPFKKIYYPYENYKLLLLKDKIQEFCRIMQAWGATSIKIGISNQYYDEKTNTFEKTNKSYLGIGNVNAGISDSYKKSSLVLNYLSQYLSLHQEFKPTKKPFMPSNLVWYDNVDSWKNLYEQRIIMGSIIHHSEKISVRSVNFVQETESKELEANIGFLIEFGINISEKTTSTNLDINDEVIEINVDFAPIENLKN